MQSVLQGPRRNLHGHSTANEDTVSRADGTQTHGSSTYISAILEDDEGAPCWTRCHGGLARTQGSVSWSSLVLSPPGSSRAQQNSTRHAFAPQSRAPGKKACARGVGRQRPACWRKKIAHARAERQERGGERDIPEHNIDIQSTAQETRPTSTTVKTRTGPQYTPTHVPQELAPLFHCHSTCADEDDAAKLLARTQGTREDAPGKPITGKSKIRSHTGNGGGGGGARVWGDLCSPW